MNNLDSGTSIFFERELERIKAKTYDILYAPLSANRLIPVDRSTPPGATTVTYSRYDSTGSAKIIANYADDLPGVDVRGIQYTSALMSIGNHFAFSLEDIRAAQFAGKPLEQRRANAAAQSHMQLMNKLAFFGDPLYNVQGWLSNDSVNKTPVAGASAAARLWSAKDPTAIYTDLVESKTFILSNTKGVENPDVIVLPIEQYERLVSTRMAAGTDTTIAQFFLRNNPGMTLEFAPELKGAFTGGTDGFITYKRSMDKFWQEIPQAFETFAPQWDNLAYKVPCHSKHGGTIIAYPQSQVFRYGI
jgi:hypothetical protein